MPASAKIVVLGATGRLGRALVRRYSAMHEVIPLGRSDLDLFNLAQIEARLSGLSFDALINAAGVTDVDRSETHPDEARASNATAPELIARICHERGARFVHVSTDYVFSGDDRRPKHETDAAEPANVYGRTKLEGERLVMAACPDALILRISWLFGLDKDSFPDRIIKTALASDHVSAVSDKWSSPTYAEDLASWLQPFLSDQQGCSGLMHLCNSGWASWQEYGQEALDIAAGLGLALRTRKVEPLSMKGFPGFKAARPPFTVLATDRFQSITGIKPRPWQEALTAYIRAKYLR
jgi:dTDP-4-dehydrorhamnose reductase